MPEPVTLETAAPATPVDETDNLKDDSESEEIDDAEVAKGFSARIEASKKKRRTFSGEWKRNVELRMGKTVALGGGVGVDDNQQSEINPDWSLTKTKTANLYSQVPQVQITHENKKYGAAIPPFAKSINYELGEKRCNAGVPMDEALNDIVNASGVGAIDVGYAARFETKQVPVNAEHAKLPPQVLQQGIAAGLIQMTTAEVPTDTKFYWNRISPIDLLWPSEFTGSNFDNGDFIGYTGRHPWAVAKTEFKLKEEQKDAATGGDNTPNEDDLRSDTDRGPLDLKTVRYDIIYYWRYRVDPNERSFDAIWKLVKVHGIEKPVIHEPWKGQKLDDQSGKYIGNRRFPVRVCTVTYISDNPIPPSDSSAGRPQVNDLRRSRSQMFQNRERSIPMRWFNVNLVDPLVQESMMRGTWQGILPVNGDGSRAFGEIARASYPSEDMSFDQAAKADLYESWHLGPNQTGGQSSGGKKTGAEVSITQQNFATVMGQEKGKVAAFFLSCVEITAGWMVLYSDFPILSDEEKQAMQKAWDAKHILHDLVLKMRPDSQIVLDSDQRLKRLTQFLNITAKSGFVNVKPIIVEMAELSGIDPAEVIIDPQPKAPEEPNISYRFSGKDDLMNVGVVAMLDKHKKLPDPANVDNAKKFLAKVGQPEDPPPPPGAEGQGGAPGQPGHPPPGPPGAHAGQHPPKPGDAHPDWHLMDKIAKRSRDI